MLLFTIISGQKGNFNNEFKLKRLITSRLKFIVKML